VTEEYPKSWPDRSAENVLAPDPVPAPEPVPEAEPASGSQPAPEPLPVPGPEPERVVEGVAVPAPVEAVPEPEADDDEEKEEGDTPAPSIAPAAEHAPGELSIPGEVGVLEGEAGPTNRLVAIVVGKFNADITTRMLEAAIDELDSIGVPRAQVTVVPVPGAFELPLAAMALAKTRRYICVVALGCVIRGETPHFDFVASEAASGLQLAGLETGVPVSFGVLTCDNAEQAESRIGKGADAVRAALEMADLFSQLRQTASGG
jgi:6,7-dimethyl-8-ribityllumazine synthase